MKLTILDQEGKKAKEMDSKLFEEPIREDIIRKVVEAERIWQPFSSKFRAGMDISASGLLNRRRHVWKSSYGRGISRVPRKIFWRRGTQFSWEGAIIPSVKGGRRAHPPKNSVNLKKINKKEFVKAILSSLSYVSNVEKVKNKYSSLENKDVKINFPLIVEDKVMGLNTKEFLESLKKILGDFNDVSIQKKSIRAGIGKMRGRKYKKNSGLLLVSGKDENKKVKGIEIVKADELSVSDLSGNGARLTIFSEKAIKDLEDFALGEKSKMKEDNVEKEKKKKVDKRKTKKTVKKSKVKKVKKEKKEDA